MEDEGREILTPERPETPAAPPDPPAKKSRRQRNRERGWRWCTNLLIVIPMAFVLLYDGETPWAFAMMFLGYLLPGALGWVVSNYLPFIGIHGAVLLYTGLTHRPIFKKYFFGLRGNNWWKTLIGFAIGFGMNGLCIIAAWLHGDVGFALGQLSLPLLALLVFAFVAVFIQSAAEELLCRGYLYFYIRERHSAALAILLPSVLFGLLHLGNTGVTLLAVVNIALFGVLFALLVYYFDSLWMAMAGHAAWNFCQNFLFGLPNSGMESEASVLRLTVSRPSPFYDPVFGVENTWFVCGELILAIGAVVLLGELLRARRRRRARREGGETL